MLFLLFSLANAADDYVQPPGEGFSVGLRLGGRNGPEVPVVTEGGNVYYVYEDQYLSYTEQVEGWNFAASLYRQRGGSLPVLFELRHATERFEAALAAGVRPVKGLRIYDDIGLYGDVDRADDFVPSDREGWYVQPMVQLSGGFVRDLPAGRLAVGAAFDVASLTQSGGVDVGWYDFDGRYELKSRVASGCAYLSLGTHVQPRLSLEARPELCMSFSEAAETYAAGGDTSPLPEATVTQALSQPGASLGLSLSAYFWP
jgi:hypothetical protein